MKENKDQLEQIIKSEYDRIAQDEEVDIQTDEDISVPEGMQDIIRERLDNQIEEWEREKTYSRLSEEDRKALELGRKMLAEEKEKSTVKVVRKRRPLKVYIGLVAVLVIVLGMGMTSMGGPERIVKLVKQVVGKREIEKINSSEDNLISVEENEEEAYQKVAEEFGTEPVKIMQRSKELKFEKMEFDEVIQTAELYYSYNNESVIYLINASYASTSLGIDVEDDIINSFKKIVKGCEVEIKEYKVAKANKKRYSASFKYNGLEYFLIGTTNKEDFEVIVNNLFFYK